MPRPDEGGRDPSEAWPTLPTSEGFALSLREILLSLLTLKSDVKIQTVAEMAGIHPRALQRRLAEEGTDFRTVLSKARHLRARQLLAETDLSLTEIASELKYSDLAHFSRAYRRWAGAPPSDHRRAPEVLGHAVS